MTPRSHFPTPGRTAVAAVALLIGAAAAPAQHVTWRTEYNAARREATEKNRPLVLEFGTEACFWCKKLESTTLRDPAVAALLNDRFVPVKLDAERETTLSQALRIQTYPTLIVAAPEGKILGILEGYLEPEKLLDNLQKALAASTNAAPDWMTRDMMEATKAITDGDNPRAVALLKTILEDKGDRPVQVKAREALKALEQQADGRLARAKQLEDKGQTLEAMDTLAELMRSYPDTPAAAQAKTLIASLAMKPEIRDQQRGRRAKELLAQAREEFRTQQFSGCLDRCDLITANYPLSAEANEAVQMAAEIRSNPDWLAKACDQLNEKLGNLYLAQAESWSRKGDKTQAAACLEKVRQLAPGSQLAQMAQTRLKEMTGKTGVLTGFEKP